MNDRPTGIELLRAVERFLETEVVPALDGVRKFHARVAANVVAIVAHEIETEDTHLREEFDGLEALLGDPTPWPEEREARHAAVSARNEALVARIRVGDADAGEWRRAVLAHCARVVESKLAVARPPRQRD